MVEQPKSTDIEDGVYQRRQCRPIPLAKLFCAAKLHFTYDPLPDELQHIIEAQPEAPQEAQEAQARRPRNLFILSNHVSDFDPFLLHLAFPDIAIHYFVSEHIFRSTIAGTHALKRFLTYICDPIPAIRHIPDIAATKKALRHFKKGRSVCLYPTGEHEWDGYSPQLPAAVGKLAKQSRTTVVTWRMEGMYFAHPRWARHARRLPNHGRVVNVYPPEQTAAMSAEELARRISDDIRCPSDEWRRALNIPTKGKRLAEWLEKVVFVCPECGAIDSFHSHGDKLACKACGLTATYTDRDTFLDGKPFGTLHEWNEWQTARFAELVAADAEAGALVLHDAEGELRKVAVGTGEELIATGPVSMSRTTLSCAGREFPIDAIRGLGLVARSRIIFAVGAEQYELLMPKPCNILKYEQYYRLLHSNG